MPIRITGMNSGLDTEAIIKELASAKSYKKTKMEKAQTKLGWKQDAWKALNTKIYSFYTQTLDDMRFSSAYSKKKVTCSNSSAVSIVAGENAPYSTQSLDVRSIAKAGYMTGGEISTTAGGKVSGDTLLSDLGIATSASFDITVGAGTAKAKTTTIKLDKTVDDVVSQLRSAGVDVNFDEKNQRFFVNAKNTGKENDFTISATNAAGTSAVEALGLALSTSGDKMSLSGGTVTGSTTLHELGSFTFKTGSTTDFDTSFNVTVNGKTTTIDLNQDTKVEEVVKKLKDADVDVEFDEKNQSFSFKNEFTISGNSTDPNSASAIKALGLPANVSTKFAHYEAASDAEIKLNGVSYFSSNNTFEVNGLTITANEVALGMTITTQADTSGIFDAVKNFFKGYNELINEMDKLYGADSAKGYEPLTDEEKDALSDSEVEKWEKKIKDAVLRKDSTLSGVASVMKEVMSKGVTMSDGKPMYLFDFGIETLGYFNAPENEKNAYHIDGDADDSNTKGNDNKLMAMIMSDPEKVTEFFTSLANNLHDVLYDKMKGVEGVSSSFCVYEDKLLQEEYDEYTTQIAQQQKKVDAFMDRYYAKFSAMETALARMESKSNAVAQLLGM